MQRACAPNVIISAYKQAVSAHYFAGSGVGGGKRELFQIIPLGRKWREENERNPGDLRRLTNGGSTDSFLFWKVSVFRLAGSKRDHFTKNLERYLVPKSSHSLSEFGRPLLTDPKFGEWPDKARRKLLVPPLFPLTLSWERAVK